MHSESFHPVIGDTDAQVGQVGVSRSEAGDRAAMSVTGLAPAGADEVSVQAAIAFHQDASSMLELYRAAQGELKRVGLFFTQLAQT